MKKGNSGFSSSEVDRISNLPDSLIHHILSFMYTKYAVKTCVLSKRWRYIWNSLSVLNFSEKSHISESNDEDSYNESHSDIFVEFVDRVLNLRDKSDIQLINLDCSNLYTTGSIIYGWIDIAVERNVQELYIKTKVEDGFKIPPCLCTCESLTKLELQLTGWVEDDYENRITLPCDMSLPRLKLLHLRLEHISFDDDDENQTNRFFSSFPSLELLIIEIGCRGFHNTKLDISLPKLKYFVFDCQNDESNSGVKLHAPSLASFSCVSYLSTNFILEGLSSLVDADIEIKISIEDYMPASNSVIHEDKKEFYVRRCMRFLRGLHKAKVLTLRNSFIKALGGAPHILDTQLLEFHNLKCLELWSSLSRDCLHSIFYVLKISPNMESVSLQISKLNYGKRPEYPYCDKVKFNEENIGDYWDTGLSLPCMICRLKFIEIQDLHGCVNELKFLEILLKHAPVLEKVLLKISLSHVNFESGAS
ncbi:hypothetical protein MKW98_008475 [Papaver atlanticum]|uniref:F-box domain-containing protein n=1 Tax=Papaver atlanticum TaxID=357466 RepID=A0AAD4TL51_9MAGN|nr:hypothetical protein MKW98_008475 [Papaver atlanticum]